MDFRAIYYDGRTSVARSVIVTVDATSVVVSEPSGEVLRSDPLTAVAVAPRLGNTTRSLRFADGAKVETQDNAAVDTLERSRGGGAAHRLIHELESHWRTALGCAAAVIVIAVAGLVWGVPWLAKQIAFGLPPAMARDIGRGTLATLDQILFEPTKLSAERQEQLRGEFRQMASHYPETPLVLVFRRAMPNAFALPDGTVVVTDELIDLAENDQEILAVLAHEIGHVHERHALRMALENSAVAVLALTYFGDATQVTTLVSGLPAVFANAHFSRSHETEADTFALGFLDSAGIPRHHFADILRRLDQKLGGGNGRVTTYFDSHPGTEERALRFIEGGSQ